MPEDPLSTIAKLDPALLECVEESRALALADGALPARVKLLVAMALDASHGAVGGVKALAQAAMKAGATREEIGEALRVANFVCGVGSVYTAAHALDGVV